MIELKETAKLPLTLEVAKHYHRMTALDGDREIDSRGGRKRIDLLREMNVKGLFYSPVWSDVQVASENGRKFRVDGTHSTQMLVESGADFPKELEVTVRHFRCSNMAEAVELWELFNPKLSTRTTQDIARNRAAYVPELKGVSVSAVLIASRGIATHYNTHDSASHTKPEDCITEHPQFIAFANEFVHVKQFKKSGVMAAMFSTWGRDRQQCGLFWRRVRDESATDPKCATRTLAKYLEKQGVRSKVGVGVDPAFVMYVKCHHAWNAWRKSNTTALNFVKGCPIPKAI